MLNSENISQELELLRTYRRNLATLLFQEASMGGKTSASLNVINNIVDTRKKIAECKAILRSWGISVPEIPTDREQDQFDNSRTFIPTLRNAVADFVGREQEIARLIHSLTVGSITAICGVRGMGGIGKTELAHIVAHRLASQFPDGQVLVDLQGADNVLSANIVLQRMLHALGIEVELPADVDHLLRIYRTALTEKRMLVVADNARDAAQVRLLIPPGGNALLVTSRHRFSIPGMTIEDLHTLPPAEAYQLLITICPRIDSMAPILAERCGYLPLALRVSASLLANDDALRVDYYIESLAHTRTKLAHLRDPDDPDLDVEASLRLSYDALNPTAQSILCQLSVFPLGFNMETVHEVLEVPENIEDVLGMLRRRNLIEWSETSQQYELHDLVRALAAKELDIQLGAHLTERYTLWNDQLMHKMIALHQQVMQAMYDDLARARLAAAEAFQVAARSPSNPLLAAQAHWSQGSAVLFVPDYAGALAHFDAALEAYERAERAAAPHEPARDVRAVQIMRLLCLTHLGRYAEAHAAERAARAWLVQHPNDRRLLSLITNSSILAGDTGDYERMIALADEALALADSLDEIDETAYAWINRAYACIFLGRFDEAEQALERGIAAATTAENWLAAARGVYNRAVLRRCQGQLFAALRDLHAARLDLERVGGEIATVALEEATLYTQLRQMHEAQRAALRAAEQFASQSMPTYSARAALFGARIAVQQGQFATARQLLIFAREQARHASPSLLDAEVALGEALLVAGRARHATPRVKRAEISQAYHLALDAVAQLTKHGLVETTAEGELAVAALEVLCGKVGAARRRYARLTRHLNRDVQMRAAAELAALLPSATALPWWQKAAALSIAERRMLLMEELQATYDSATLRYHFQLAACHTALGQVESALESIWEANAGLLLDLRASAAQLGDGAQVSLERDKANIARLRVVEDELRRSALCVSYENHSGNVAFYEQRADTAARERADYERRVAASLRTQGGHEGQAAVPSLADVQAQLRADEALLEFTCWDDTLMAVLVRPDQPPQLRVLGSYGAVVALLDRWRLVRQRLINHPSPETEAHIRHVLAELSTTVLGPWEEDLAALTVLLVAPWGVLYHLPWAMLPWDDGWLSDRVTIVLTPSGAFWAAGSRNALPPNAPVGRARLLGYGGTGARWLPTVATELGAIGRYLPDAWCNFDATSADLRAMPPPRLLHIAAHVQVDAHVPMFSTIELADGIVTLLEVHRLNLRGTALVVLSAGESGMWSNSGNMALTMTGAFLCAGADAVIASLWPVEDTATVQLMDCFYAALASGSTAPAALRTAQCQMRVRAPLDWASFQLFAGAPVSLFGSNERTIDTT